MTDTQKSIFAALKDEFEAYINHPQFDEFLRCCIEVSNYDSLTKAVRHISFLISTLGDLSDFTCDTLRFKRKCKAGAAKNKLIKSDYEKYKQIYGTISFLDCLIFHYTKLISQKDNRV